jgi:beta-galactosidase
MPVQMPPNLIPHQPYLIPAERMSFSFRFCPAKQHGVSGNRQYLNFK